MKAEKLKGHLDLLLLSVLSRGPGHGYQGITRLKAHSGRPRQVRHTLGEGEAHLRDAVAEGIAAGLAEETAQVQALERIGPVHAVTGRRAGLRPSAALLRRLTLTAALVGGAGFVAIGGGGGGGGGAPGGAGEQPLEDPLPPRP